MKHFNLFLPFLFFLIIINNNNISYAKEYMGKPVPMIYNSIEDLIAENKSTYQKIPTDKWIVFADRENVPLYKSASRENKNLINFVTIHFLDRFIVSNWVRDSIYIEKVDIHNKAVKTDKIEGWASINNFILLDHARYTKNKVSTKAVLLNIKEFSDSSSKKEEEESLLPLKSPKKEGEGMGEKVSIYKFAHIYKEEKDTNGNSYLLVGKKTHFVYDKSNQNNNNYINKVILGWIPKNRMLLWNTREALELNTQRKIPAYFFKKEKDLRSYYDKYSNSKIYPLPSCKDFENCKSDDPILAVKVDDDKTINRSKRPDTDLPYIILEENQEGTEPFKIGIPSIYVDIPKIITPKSIQMDIAFLIDATMSMEPYLKITSNIVQQFIQSLKKKEKKIRFGISLYRDYQHGKQRFEKLVDLTDNIQLIQEQIKHKSNVKREKPEGKNDPALFLEAVFQGIKRCINDMDWKEDARRLIIHIGDAGNNSRGKDNINENELSDLLCEKDFSYSAILYDYNSDNPKIEEAQRQFYNETKEIINLTQQKWIKKLPELCNNNQKLIDKYRKGITNCKPLKSEYSESKSFTPYNKCRWMLTSFQTEETFRDKIETQIKKLSKELSDIVVMMKNFVPSIKGKQDKALSIQPVSKKNLYQLGASVLYRNIKKVGEDILTKIQKGDQKLKKIAIQIVSNENDIDIDHAIDLQNKKRRTPEEEKELMRVVYVIGKHQLWNFIDADAQFYSAAYVYKIIGDNELFNKVILLKKTELEQLIKNLNFAKLNGWKVKDADTLLKVVKPFITIIPGESTRQFGDNNFLKFLFHYRKEISSINDHKLIRKKEIQHFQAYPNSFSLEDLKELKKLFKETHKNLNKIYNGKPHLEFHGNTYYWVPASSLL